MFTVFLNMALFSCTPNAIESNVPTATEEEDCCGNGGNIPPPPPPTNGG